MRHISSKRILSFLIALTMVIGLVPGAVFAALSNNAIVTVYRNPEKDYAANGFSTSDIAAALEGFYVRDNTLNTWKDQIISAAGVEGDDVHFYVETVLDDYVTLTGNYLFVKPGYFFGWTAARNHVAGTGYESRVQVVKNTTGLIGITTTESVTNDLTVNVKGYVDITYDIAGTEYKDQVSLNYAINNAEDDFNGTDTDYAAAVAAAEKYAADNTENGTTYTFLGWDTNSDGVVDNANLSTIIDVTNADGAVAANDVEGAVYTAVYGITHTVSFSGAEVEPIVVADKATVTTLPEIDDTDDFTFGGWYTDADCTEQFVITTPITESITLYAKWDLKVPTKEQAAKLFGEIPVTVDCTNEETDCKNTEFTLVADAISDITLNGTVATVTVNANYYVNQVEDHYGSEQTTTLTLEYNNGWTVASTVDSITYVVACDTEYNTVTYMNGNESYDSVDVIASESHTVITAPEAEDGYEFKGWNNGNTMYQAGETITPDTDITLNAVWELIDVTLTFTNGEETTEYTIKYGSTLGEIPENPVKDGYKFDGWVENTTGSKFDADAPVKANADYTAKWLIQVTFDANGGNFVNEGVVLKPIINIYVEPGYNKTISLVVTIEKDGYNFAGWEGYTAGMTITEPVTFKAIWEFIKLDTEITVNEAENNTYTITYGDDAAEAIGAEVMSGDTAVEDAKVSYSADLAALTAGEHTVTISYAGNDTYNAAEDVTVTVIVNKATAAISVANQTYKYGEGPEVADPITANCATIDFVAGLDVHDETNLVGLIQVALPLANTGNVVVDTAIAELLKKYGTEDLSINEFIALLKAAQELYPTVGELFDGIQIDEATVDALIETIKTYAEALPTDTEVVINIVDELALPTNVGVYLVGAVSADNNYETALGFGYLVITPNGIQVELSWNEEDENGIYTIPAFKAGSFDLGAAAAIVDSTVDNGGDYVKSEDPNEHIKYLFIGADADGNLILDAKLASDSKAGIYAEIAYLTNWDNNMYYAAPIVRTILLAPGVADVTFVDENNNENYARTFTYDGTAKEMKALVNGKENVDGLTVTYIGLDFHGEGYNNGEGYNDTEKPTEAGLYAAVALYREYNEDGNLEVIGGAIGAMMIEQIEPGQFELSNTTVLYDGEEHFAELAMDNKSYDYVTIAVDRVNNVAYVNLPDDMDKHIARLPEAVQEEIASLVSQIQDNDIYTSTVKEVLTDAINDMIDLDLDAKIVEVLEKVVDEVKAEAADKIDTEALKAQLEAKINELKSAVKAELPADIADMLEEYITLTSTEADVDVEGLKAELKAQISALAAKLPAEAVAELEAMVDEIIAAAQGNATVAEIKETVKDALAKLEALEVPDAETLVKYALGALAGVVDIDQVKEVVSAVIAKVEEQAIVDETIALVKNIAGIYTVDTSDLEAAVDALIAKIKAKAESGKLDDNDLANLEADIDDLLEVVLATIDQLPDDGRIVFGSNPTEIGEYDCYAMNISANYKPTFVEATLVIRDARGCETVLVDRVDPTCTEDGYEEYGCGCENCDCDNCVESYMVTLEALGHDYGDWYVTKEATYREDGEERRDCQRADCDHYEVRSTSKKELEALLPAMFNINVETTEGGTVPGLGADGHGLIALYASRTLKFVCEEGYEVADVIVNDVSIGAVSKYRIKTAVCDYNIQVIFRPIVVEEPAE